MSYEAGDIGLVARGTLDDGDSGYLSGAQARAWRVGDRCPVFYNPADPDKSVWAG